MLSLSHFEKRATGASRCSWNQRSPARPLDEIEARLSPDRETLYFSSDRTTPVVHPRNRETADRDLRRIQ